MERLPNSCRNQYLRVLQRDFTYGAWTIAEEQRLTELVKKYSTRLGESQYVGISWKAVEAEMGTRSACQCIKKWYSGFGARALGRPWTASEDLALVQAVQEDGATEWSGTYSLQCYHNLCVFCKRWRLMTCIYRSSMERSRRHATTWSYV